MVFRCLFKSNSDRAAIIAKKTTTTTINASKDTETGLPNELVGVGVEVVVVEFDDDVSQTLCKWLLSRCAI